LLAIDKDVKKAMELGGSEPEYRPKHASGDALTTKLRKKEVMVCGRKTSNGGGITSLNPAQIPKPHTPANTLAGQEDVRFAYKERAFTIFHMGFHEPWLSTAERYVT
jgi:hypothetical protein